MRNTWVLKRCMAKNRNFKSTEIYYTHTIQNKQTQFNLANNSSIKMQFNNICSVIVISLIVTFHSSCAITYKECENAPEDTFVNSLESCQMYIYCDGDDSYSGECDEGQYFDGESCDDAENVYCALDDTDEPEPERPDQAVTVVPPTVIIPTMPALIENTTNIVDSTSTSDPLIITPVVRDHCPDIDDAQQIVLMPNKQTCTDYYLCYHGHAIEMRCTDNLHFNIQNGKCDFPEHAQCLIDRPNANKCLPHVTDFFPHPANCNYFYYCIRGFLTVQQCPFYYGWDIERRSCVQMGQAKCFGGSKRA
ncbi:probable chitinase 10 [Eurosta solidaginis]|uniref:probable chitinase 10 n=1 Tax=Eurosta solidaginis TaxID=178769 RepID=UPI003530E15C